MFATIALITIIMAGTVVLQHQSTLQAQALSDNSLTLAVEPSVYHAKAVNETFSVNINIYNVNDTMQLDGFQFKLSYCPNLLAVLSVKNGTFFDPFAASPNGGTLYFGPQYGTDALYNYTLYAGLILPDSGGVHHAPFPSGNGTLATITFKAIYQPTSPVPNAGACDLVLYSTILADNNANKIPHKVVNGHYDIGPFLAVEPSVYHAKAVNETFSVNINIYNVIDTTQLVGFQFKLSYNKTLLNIVSVKNGSFFDPFAGPLPPNGGTLYFGPSFGTDALGDYVLYAGMILPDSGGVWHAPFPSGNGTLATINFKVIYQPTPPQTSAACNLTLYSTILADFHANLLPHNYWPMNGYFDIVLPTLVGDLNSDGKVDILDAITLAKAFGSTPGEPNWNALADLNHDNIVDIFDAIMLGAHFGQTS
jgi:hypothetical protein